MRPIFALISLLFAHACSAGVVNLPAEAGSPVNEDDWSIPLHRCMRSADTGVGVYDGAERCAIEFALAVEPGRYLSKVRALYEDADLTSHFTMRVMLRDVVTGANLTVVSGLDDTASLSPLESMSLLPGLIVPPNAAAFVLVEVRGDTALKALTYTCK